jgi:type I restriction enzyme S subunit
VSEKLPQGWEVAELGALGRWRGGGTPSKSVPAYWSNGTVHWVSPKDMKRLMIDSAEDQITLAAVKESAANLIPKDSVLMVTRSGILEHTFPVAINTVEVAVNQDLKAWTPYPGINPLYAAYFLKAEGRTILDDCAKDGTTVASIDFDRLKAYPVRLAPEPEQARIVSKIDELFSSIDEGESALERARKLVERYRQSVLKAAVTGELTREWRERHAGELESGEALLIRILEARRKAWETAEVAKMTANGLRPANSVWKKRYREPVGVDTSQHSELPSGWSWATLPMLCAEDSINGISVKGTNAPPGVAALRLDAITANGFDYSAIRYIPISKAKAARLSVCTGDFFVSRANGSIRLVGKAVLANQPPGIVVFPDTMIRYRLLSAPDLRSWLQMVWPSRLIRSQIERLAKTTAGIHKISQGDIGQIAIPVPPLEEQEEIRSLVELRLSQADRLLQEAESSLKLAKSVRHGTLKSAFSGQLVPQDSTDEPASVLLERIAAMRSVSSSEMRTAKKERVKRDVSSGLAIRGTSTRKGKA